MAAANLDICNVIWCLCLHSSQYWLRLYHFWITKTIKILVNSGLIEIFLFSNCFKYILKGDLSDSELKLDAFCLSVKQNRLSSIGSIEFGNRTHQKIPVRLCSIAEPIEHQSDRLGSIEFYWYLVRFHSIDYAWCTGLGTSNLYQSIWRSNLELRMRFKRNRKSYHKDKVNYFININNFPLFSTSVDVPSSIVYVYRQGDKGLYSYLAIFGGNSNSVPESRNSENSIIDRKKLAPKQ